MKLDPYKHKERYLKWKELTQEGIPSVSKENSDLIKQYIGDMEKGINVSSESSKGPRGFNRLNTLRDRMIFFSKNFEEKIIKISKQALGTKYEKRKIELLTSLNGVSIPVASAILTLVDPKNYGIIDIRVWQTLFLYGVIKTKPSGMGFNFGHWYTYLMKIRYYARKLNVNVRDIERTLYDYHKTIQEGTLYK